MIPQAICIAAGGLGGQVLGFKYVYSPCKKRDNETNDRYINFKVLERSRCFR